MTDTNFSDGRENLHTPAMTYKCLGWHATVPAGAYFLGDPCYAVPGGAWGALLQTCDVFTTPVGTVLGHEVLAFGTQWGDGEYTDQHGHKYCVDAGLIGLTPIALARQCSDFARLARLGQLVEFENTALCKSNGKGLLTFGGYLIDTNSL